MKTLFVSARSASILLDRGGDYFVSSPVSLFLQADPGSPVLPLGQENRSVFSLFDLQPDTEYTLTARGENGPDDTLSFHTEPESFTLDVRRFGARGDGITDDTAALQAAICCCPAGGRVLLPAGTYASGPLFLRSHITVELQRGATLSMLTDRDRHPILPGVTRPSGQGEDLLLGSWEGNPLDNFASAFTGVEVEDVRLTGEGIVDGRGLESGWWANPKGKNRAYRGHLLYLVRCRGITVQGLTFRNSPSWNLHPIFSENLTFVDIRVEAPAVSPNTDGFDPQSCRGIRLWGARFSVGDDCIAIKSGKIYMGQKYHLPCEDIEIAWCAMLDGHGGVTVGSEMSGGVRNVRVHHCLMRGNDRGLRIKTRRGRGQYAVIDDIRFQDVRMEGVKTPLVVNCMYFCDPDGHSAYVQSRNPQPVDDTTPTVGAIDFERVTAHDCQACVAFALGLPERPIGRVRLADCSFDFLPDAPEMVPAMAEGVPSCHNRGVIAENVQQLIVENVSITGIQGPEVEQQ